jgi:hypothetical protein
VHALIVPADEGFCKGICLVAAQWAEAGGTAPVRMRKKALPTATALVATKGDLWGRRGLSFAGVSAEQGL